MGIQLDIQESIPLSGLTTFKIGGRATLFVECTTEDQVCEALRFAARRNLKIFVLGGGSNVLIADQGFDGLVVRIAIRGINIVDESDNAVLVSVGAGEDWDDFVGYCVDNNFAGVECLSGIPGLVGGTPIQNVGAYGQEVSESIVSVRVIERGTGKTTVFGNGQCGFEYRKSVFNTTEKDRYIVISVEYRLKKQGSPKIAYRELDEHFSGSNPSLAEVRKFVRQIRSEKGMLVRQAGRDAQSAGSFFKNPIVSMPAFEKIVGIADRMGFENVPSYEIDKANRKVPAAWLIEKSGFEKGYQLGRAGISTKHALALTNRDGATAEEVISLMKQIQSAVNVKFGVSLEPEPNLIGF